MRLISTLFTSTSIRKSVAGAMIEPRAKIILAAVLSSGLLLTACQKADEPVQTNSTDASDTEIKEGPDNTEQPAADDTADTTEMTATDSLQQAQSAAQQQSTTLTESQYSDAESLQGVYPYNLTQGDNSMPATTPINSTAAASTSNTANNTANNTASHTATNTAASNTPSRTARANSSATSTAPTFTSVEYQDDQGRSMQVTFQETSNAERHASLSLPSGKQILLSAPASSGKNTTYRSADGSIELNTRQAGGAIEVKFEGQSTTLTAVN